MQECSVSKCAREKYGKSELCSLHKHRVEQTGDPHQTNHNLREIGDTGVMTNEISPLCSIDDCEEKYIARGWCRKHYKRWKATGDPLQTNSTPRMVGDTGEVTQVYSKICSIEDCGKPHFVRNWCSMHYSRWQKHGDPLVSKTKKGFNSIIDSFLDHQPILCMEDIRSFVALVRKPGMDSDCWEWQGPHQRDYAKVSKVKDGKHRGFYVHRMVLEISLGRPLHNKMQAHHKCSNTICVNPDHLEESTHNENTGEMKARSYFLARIEELEEALAEFDPTHALLS